MRLKKPEGIVFALKPLGQGMPIVAWQFYFGFNELSPSVVEV